MGLHSSFSTSLAKTGTRWGECLSCLDEWLVAQRYVAWIDHAEQVLTEETDAAQLRWLMLTLGEAGDWWSKPVVGNGRFDRPAGTFVSVLRLPENCIDSFIAD